MNRVILIVSVMLLAAGLLAPVAQTTSQAQAQGGTLCFNVPNIDSCIEGRFRQYWEQNGGLAVFGFPISPPMMLRTDEGTDGTSLIQFFERSRFELHPKNNVPYDVLLSRLGDERLKQLGRNWETFPKGTQTAGCLFFAATGHSICNQEGDTGFKSYWESHGLRTPQLDKFNQSLALFGLPLSEAAIEKNASGETVLTQWFERARFEFHPANPRESKVLLGLLGNETHDTLPPPGGPCTGIDPPSGATIVPNCVKAGKSFVVEVSGFEPDQELSYWITDETGFIVGTVQSARSTVQGRFNVSIDTSSFSEVALKPGNYTFIARDVEETVLPAAAPFRVIP